MVNKVHENEMWWQENGLYWGDEVDRRRSLQPLYGIQEVVLSHVFSKLPKKSKILEFGVGFGRHVEYLSDITELEVYGVDQSPTMIQSFKDRVSHKSELIKNVHLIEPRTKLPFPDGYFDFVYTVSVLIHINPNDLKDILKELTRVAKHGIIHLENNYVEHAELKFMDHNGCWQQSIVHEYEELGLTCSVLEKTATEQDVYYTNLSGEWSKEELENKVMFSRLHLLDSKIRPTIAKFEGEIGWRAKELEERIENGRKLDEQLSLLQKENSSILSDLQQQENMVESLKVEIIEKVEELSNFKGLYHELLQDFSAKELEASHLISNNIYLETKLNEIENSLAWKLVSKIRGMQFVYALSKPARKVLNIIREHKRKMGIKEPVNTSSRNEEVITETTQGDKKKMGWLVNLLKEIPEGAAIAVHQPDWLGVTNSTKELFPYMLPLRELYDNKEIQDIAQLIVSRNPELIIFSGFAVGYSDLAKIIKEMKPHMSIKVFWHGNTTHMYEDYSWSRYQEIIQLSNDGIISSVGFAKESMKILYEKMGHSSYFVKNTVKSESSQNVSKKVSDYNDSVKVGIYASGNTWNKNAFTQIAAAGLMNNVTVHSVPYTSRMKHFAQQLKIKFEGNETQIIRENLLNLIELNDINFYVTFSECAPLLPLESLNRGVPCLTGPNHHYFANTPLEEFLVVTKPDDPVEIYKKAIIALENKNLIIELYNEWKRENDVQSAISVSSFIGRK
jgi:ubiquinone/menaquinone biosynthesis C-methylase UbiE